MDVSEPPVPRVAVVLDVPGAQGRRLAETVRAAGFEPRAASDPEDLVARLRAERSVIAVVAFEALWPDPQTLLRNLREWTPGTRYVVVYSEGAPRLRLGQRLWAVGLLDYLLPRSTEPHALAPVLRQAFADARIELGADDGEGAGQLPDLSPLSGQMRLLQNLMASFASQRRVEGVVRELQIKLPQLVDFEILQVLVTDRGSPRLFVSQARPVSHEVIWQLAGDACAAIAPFSETSVGPEDLIFVECAPSPWSETTDLDPAPSGARTTIALPMVLAGELVGCLALVARPGAMRAEQRTILRLVSYQLGASVRSAQALELADEVSLIDELTGAYNRRYLGRALEAEWRRARRYGLPLSLALLDIDHFTKINELHGHGVGDAVLRSVTSHLRRQLRDTDHLVRYAGEQFLLLLPETGPSEAALVLERLRLLFARVSVFTSPEGVHLQVSISAGIASSPSCEASSAEELVALADQAVQAAKVSGRDRVCVASGQGTVTLPAQEGQGAEKRRFPRLSSQLRVRFVQLPELDGRLVTMQSTDLSAGGVAVKGPQGHLRKSAYALVQLEDGGSPILSRVVWTKEDTEQGTRTAGLQFLESADLQALETRKSTPPATPLKALVVSERTQTRDLVARVLEAARYQPHMLYDTVEGLERTWLEDYALVVIGESSLRRGLGGRLQEVRSRANPSLRIVVINEAGDRDAAIDTIRSEHVEHMIGTAASEEVLFATLKKLLLGEYFGMQKYLLWGADPRTWTVLGSDGKDLALTGIRQVAREVRCHPRITDLLVAAVDEMIINALYRPLVDPAFEPEPVTVECGSDGRLLAVSVRDEHGLFRPEDMFRGLGEALQHQDRGIPPEATQASLGFRIMLGALSQLAINVEPGVCTELIGIVDLRKSLREYRQAAPTVGFFRKDDS